MVSNITLTSPIRSNLLSLTNIAKQMDKTQLILATGKKVNTALDNASAYYQARSLTNRSADLNALLDAMDQGIQTIEAASQGIETATSLLEQMQSITTQAGAVGQALSKEDLQALVGANGAVVETADELRAAINSGKETICVYGNIDLGDITDTGGISLKANQKLVGAGYFGDNVTECSIIATSKAANSLINITQGGCLVSDLSIDYINTVDNGMSNCIYINGTGASAKLSNLDLNLQTSETNTYRRAVFYVSNGAIVDISDKINIKTLGSFASGLFTYPSATLNIHSDANINITTSGQHGHGIYTVHQAITSIDAGAVVNINTSGDNAYGIYTLTNSQTNIAGNINITTSGQHGHGIYTVHQAITSIDAGAVVNINTSGDNAYGIYTMTNSKTNIESGADVNINTSGDKVNGIYTVTNSKTNIEGNINITTLGVDGFGIVNSGDDSGNYTFVASTAQIYFNTSYLEIYHAKDSGAGNNILEIAQGAKLAFEKNDNVKWYEVSQDYKDENDSGAIKYITPNNITTMIPGITETTPWTLPTGIEKDKEDNTAKKNIAEYQSQFNTVLDEYNKLINDCSYQGINLLKGGNLKVVFNEHRSHVFNVLGQDITAVAIGLNKALWQTTGDINRSVSELTQAITTLRSLAESLGNQYSIIQTRADFTEGLTDILEVGADELTLADMNEASAQYLSLQTRQQLALNSLSLAAQSAQSVLSLF